ncbi:hypothetical protein JTB14_025921 [Gonioctena quinquepunctata]|nr:hypothetical protein JTB14_025921 [Gonioctena quinquepunctata]
MGDETPGKPGGSSNQDIISTYKKLINESPTTRQAVSNLLEFSRVQDFNPQICNSIVSEIDVNDEFITEFNDSVEKGYFSFRDLVTNKDSFQKMEVKDSQVMAGPTININIDYKYEINDFGPYNIYVESEDSNIGYLSNLAVGKLFHQSVCYNPDEIERRGKTD